MLITEPSRQDIQQAYHQDEASCVSNLLQTLNINAEAEQAINTLAANLVDSVRKEDRKISGVETLITHYDLSTPQGLLLMTLAEALLRIPDRKTQDLLLQDKLGRWPTHSHKNSSLLVNFSSFGFGFAKKILSENSWLKQSSQPFIRQAALYAIKMIGNQFVVGQTLSAALQKSANNISKGYLYSYDMLGEVARTQEDADRYFQAYRQAILGLKSSDDGLDITRRPSISVKLSALYPRYVFTHYKLAVPVLIERLQELATLAREANIGLTVDAEEADRLEMSLAIFAAVFGHSDFKNWSGLGLAVQAYQKRALPVIHWLIELAKNYQKRICVRLVKGAYWDTEIKLAQMAGLNEYPVFTRRANTDVSYLTCAQEMLKAPEYIYPQFATHNAYSMAAVLTMIKEHKIAHFEFQRLQGMGQGLHDQLIDRGITSRIYGPVGSHQDLLPYLVRRLLENGANSSFVNQIAQAKIPLAQLIASPIHKARSYEHAAHPQIPLPINIFAPQRLNSVGLDLSDSQEFHKMERSMNLFNDHLWQATPLCQPFNSAKAEPVYNPANHQQTVGHVVMAAKEEVEQALRQAGQAFPAWNERGVQERADILLQAADLLEQNREELISLAGREAGKTLASGIAEVREAVDFCRYYSQLALSLMPAQEMPGPTGESNVLRLSGRGPMLCISPWNFPIAIFTGQIAAALITGNVVIAKPAEQTPLAAARVVQLLHEAGIPKDALQLLPGTGETVGAALVGDQRIQGVLFTGSTETAKAINQSLANRPGPIIPLIAETGGINVMIADSSALPEQLVNDVIISAFDSAGQRCSALRVLFLQEEIADKVIEMLRGAMAELIVGDPLDITTDVGPVIDSDAKKMLESHSEKMSQQAKLIYKLELHEKMRQGTFVAPQAFELSDLSLLKREVFGPILHVIRYAQNQLPQVVNTINDLGYGLTFGIQSRVDSTIDYLQTHVRAGNIYVNRTMIGAVVGVQPFGGGRLSGTGPKAGGPHYLIRLCSENTLTINTTATGGNASLMTLGE